MTNFLEHEIRNFSMIPAYINALIREIDVSDVSLEPVLSIVFGGGTPTVLSDSEISKIINHIARKYPLRASENFIMSFETTPELSTLKNLDGFTKNGFNRVSIGAQAFFGEDLRLLGRRSRDIDILNSYENARKAGFDNINIDLMFGFPGQTFKRWRDTISEVIKLSPESVSINPFITWQRKPNIYTEKMEKTGFSEPVFEERVEMFRFAAERLMLVDYRRYMNFVFCKSGYEFSYIKDSFTLQNDTVAFGPGVKASQGNETYLREFSISTYIINSQLKRKVCVTNKKKVRFYLRDYLLSESMFSNSQAFKIFKMPLKEALDEDKIAIGMVQNMVLLGYADLNSKGFFLKHSKLYEALIYMMDYYNRSWSHIEYERN
jgi:coproporphyrinogen III oxidase-like Fe-S oxidoreductase